MAKSFKKDLKKRDYITVLNSSKDKESENEEAEKGIVEEQGRGEVEMKEKKMEYVPRSIKIRNDIWDKSQALAWWDRESLQEFFTKVLEQHIEAIPEKELAQIMQKYNKK